MQDGGESQINDIFISVEATLTNPTFEDVVPMGERSDHLPLKATIPLQVNVHLDNTGCSRPPNAPHCPQDLPEKVLHMPLSQGQRQMLVSHFEGLATMEINTIAREVQAVYNDSKRLQQSKFAIMSQGSPDLWLPINTWKVNASPAG